MYVRRDRGTLRELVRIAEDISQAVLTDSFRTVAFELVLQFLLDDYIRERDSDA